MQLLEPINLGPAAARNRLVFGAHETNLAHDRAIADRHVAYYRRRAEGGAGLIVTEDASVHPLDWPYERAPLAVDCGPGWAWTAEACHASGALVVAGLGHTGLQGSSAYSQRETWAPSRVPDAVTRELPKEMEDDDIAAVLDGFAEATALAIAAGCDGVEINAGQHSLVRQFLSGLTNLRGDAWGPGDDGRGRSRFARKVIDRVRAAAGQGLVGLRLSCDELAPWAGLTPELAAEVAAELAPLVDYLVVVRGSIFSADATRPDAHVPAGFNLDLCAQIRTAVAGATAVVAQGSIVDPGQAEWVLADGRADLVEMTRAQIADPDLGRRLADGHPERLRPCLRCNQRCYVRDARNPIVSCVVNPTAGYELTEPEAARAGDPQLDIVVVGAGPAGLEVARVAAAAGHRVAVWDRSDRVGGTVPGWATASGREPLRAIVDWLEAECRRLGVKIHLNAVVAPDQLDAWTDAGAKVVLCTGSRRRPPEYGIHTDAVVLDALDVLSGAAEVPDGPVALWDPVGGPIGVSLAETLAGDRVVRLIVPDNIAGTLLSLTGDLASAGTRLAQAGVEIVRHHVLRDVTPGQARVEDRFTGTPTSLDAAAVVDAGHRLADDQLWRASGETLPLAGDAVAPRTLYEAILEGRRVAIGLLSPVPVGTGGGSH